MVYFRIFLPTYFKAVKKSPAQREVGYIGDSFIWKINIAPLMKPTHKTYMYLDNMTVFEKINYVY